MQRESFMKNRVVLWAALAVILLSLFVAPVSAGGIELEADQDNTIYEDNVTNSNGDGAFLFSGETSLGAARRALLRFDLSGIPAGSPVSDVSLDLWCNMSPLGAATVNFDLHRLTADWGEAGSDAGFPGGAGAAAEEGDATWDDRFYEQDMPWGTPGGDFEAGSSGSASIGNCSAPAPGIVTFSSPGMVADIQAWVDDPSSNHGWILIGDETAPQSARRFISRDSGLVQFNPVLSIVVGGEDVPASSPAGMLLMLLLFVGASAFALHRRVRRNGPAGG
jgi:hypothetical protein